MPCSGRDEFVKENGLEKYTVSEDILRVMVASTNIDIDGTRESRNPVDIKIPLDKEAALKIFNGVDYELEWAIDYLNQLSIKTATNN